MKLHDDIIETVNAIVRPVVTLTLTFTLAWGFVVHLVSAEAFLGIVALCLGFWFRQREDVANRKERREKGEKDDELPK